VCGYVAPVKTCAASCGSYSSWSACQIAGPGGGVRKRTRTCTRTDCSTYTDTEFDSCCTASCGSWSTWTGGGGAQSRSRTCTRSDCTTYTESQTRCSPQSSTSCGPCSRKAPFRRTCTTTTLNSDCSSPPSRTYSEAC
jgi:hypothetical protein